MILKPFHRDEGQRYSPVSLQNRPVWICLGLTIIPRIILWDGVGSNSNKNIILSVKKDYGMYVLENKLSITGGIYRDNIELQVRVIAYTLIVRDLD